MKVECLRGVTIGGAAVRLHLGPWVLGARSRGFFVPKKNICAGGGGVAAAVSDIP